MGRGKMRQPFGKELADHYGVRSHSCVATLVYLVSVSAARFNNLSSNGLVIDRRSTGV